MAIVGFLVSYYIYEKKHDQETLVCLVGHACNEVVYSKYGRMFGISNESLGLLYYATTALIVVASLFGLQALFGFSLNLIIFILTIPALVFSLILLFIMLFVLKTICEYCLLSSAATIGIFIIEFFALY